MTASGFIKFQGCFFIIEFFLFGIVFLSSNIEILSANIEFLSEIIKFLNTKHRVFERVIFVIYIEKTKIYPKI